MDLQNVRYDVDTAEIVFDISVTEPDGSTTKYEAMRVSQHDPRPFAELVRTLLRFAGAKWSTAEIDAFFERANAGAPTLNRIREYAKPRSR